MARELERLGAGSTARRLRACGTVAQVQACHGCGDPHARVAVVATCDVRACALCARRRAARESARVGSAAARVAHYELARRPAARAELVARLRAREAGRRSPARDRDCALLRRQLHDLESAARGQWRWRMVTISPAWDPSDPVAYRVGGLRGRIEHVKAAWRRIWELCRAPGAAAYVSVECSAGGHVHLHAIIYCAFRARAALARAAGCFVDVREAHGHSVREAIKYALKAPAPRGAWLAGESRETPHPALAAAWTVASRGRRLVEPFGLMRDALAAVDACEGGEGEGGEPAKREPPRCASCGSLELDAGRPALLRDVARECLALGRARWTTAARASPRGELSTAGAMVLPPRVVISFGGDHGGRKVAARGANRAVHG